MHTWHQFAFEAGMVVTALIMFACMGVLGHQGFHVIKQQRRFGLRDLFVVVTLVAAAVGMIVGMAKENDEGIPLKSTRQLYREYQTSQQIK